MDFNSAIKNQESPIAIDFRPERHTLMLAFGGIAHKIGFPMFEFNNITRQFDSINKIYLRDLYGMWYHRGLPDMGRNIDEITLYLRQYTQHPATKRVIIFGNSGGGYAALLFGYLLQADEVHAFSAKTFIDPIKRLFLRDVNDPARIILILSLYRWGQIKYFDIKRLISKQTKNATRYHIYYAINHKFDNLHATRLNRLPYVQLHPYEYGKHNLIRVLKESGELRQIIEQAIQYQPKT